MYLTVFSPSLVPASVFFCKGITVFLTQNNIQACTGAEIEMVTAGGEVTFVERMIEESLKLRDKVQWYTSMLGKLSSVSILVERLLEAGNKNWAVTEFVQGSKTKRWAIAWSWNDRRPTMVRATSRCQLRISYKASLIL